MQLSSLCLSAVLHSTKCISSDELFETFSVTFAFGRQFHCTEEDSELYHFQMYRVCQHTSAFLLLWKISFHSIANAVRSVLLDYKAKVSRRAQSVLSKYTYAVARIYLQTFAIYSPKPLLSRAISFGFD